MVEGAGLELPQMDLPHMRLNEMVFQCRNFVVAK